MPSTADRTAEQALSWREILFRLVRGEHLSSDATSWAMARILAGETTSAQLAGFVVALRSKGETVEEISGMADAMIEFATPIEVPGPAVDVVGSGADRSNTVNVSTMAALVAAAAGARVVKHGNRAASSACGAADVLEELGVVLTLRPDQQRQVVEETGIGFLFAPLYHPSLRHAAAVRRELGIPTAFNFLGPLANPAQPDAQAVGVADPRMAELMAGVFAGRGNQGLVFHGGDGLDELTTTTSSTVWVVAGGEVEVVTLDPAELGVPRAQLAALVGGDAAVNAEVFRRLLAGEHGPVRDIVVLNAAAALTAFDGPRADVLTDQLRASMVRAEEALDSGSAGEKLEAWVAATRSFS
jgi:anthranilate phosphoribosyltransferase